MIRLPTVQGVALIKHFESLRLERYVCAAGYPTIGWGHLIRPKESIPDVISEDEADLLLARDIKNACRAVLRLINVPLEDGQYDALVSFVFNLGGGSLQRSTLRQLVNREEHDDVPEEFMKWVRAGGRVLRGLVLRRKAEAELYAYSSVLSLDVAE